MVQPGLVAAQQLCTLLTGLKDRAGLTYEKLAELASCSRGTALNYLTKPGHSSNERILNSLLSALGADDDERAEALRLHLLGRPHTPDPAAVGWKAAAAQADCTVWEMGQFTPAEATVHPAILRGRSSVDHQNVSIVPPAYVQRDFDALLNGDVAAAATGNLRALIVLCGGPSTGKTRSLFEAVHALGPGWAVVRPRSAAALRGLATTGLLGRRRCVLWLNELQTFLGHNGTGLSLDVLRDLFTGTSNYDVRRGQSPYPLVMVATLWPEKLRDATAPGDHLSDSRDLLASANQWVRRHDIPRDFSARERDRARALAASTDDDRLAAAIENRDRVGFTQTLAGGQELLQHYLTAPNRMDQLLLDAAGDARRLGHASPMPASLLHTIAIALWREERGRSSPPRNWFDTAVAHATQPLRSTEGVQALIPLDHTDDQGATSRQTTYELADYLEQHLIYSRVARPAADAVWYALQQHATSPNDVLRIAEKAIARGHFRHAEAIYRASDTSDALIDLAKWLEGRPGRGQDAEKAYRDATITGHPMAFRAFAGWLEEQSGREAETEQVYRDFIATGHPEASLAFALWLARQPGREAETRLVYRDAIAAGDPEAPTAFANWLEQQPGREGETEQVYRDALPAGDHFTRSMFALWLTKQSGREAEAEQVYRDAIAAGNPEASLAFATWLAGQPGREADAERAYRDAVAGDAMFALPMFIGWLGTQPGREADVEQAYRDAIAAGDHDMLRMFAMWLSGQPGREVETEQVHRDAAAAGHLHALATYVDWLGTQPGREGDIELICRDAVAAGHPDGLSALAGWLKQQPGREDETEQAYRDAIATGHPELIVVFAAWLEEQPGREDETEQAYRDAIATGHPMALGAYVDWLKRQPGRRQDMERLVRFGLD
ncbi:helix-turn-helix domain-containing protein [Amycolatopsis orientalis]|nr:helix-turn-helix transcriptional regulator [Amycolatopsis orientalis]